MEVKSSYSLRSKSEDKLKMNKERVKESELRFKASAKECLRIHDKVIGCIEKNEIELLGILKTEIVELKKSFEEDYRGLVEVGGDEPYYDQFTEIKDKIFVVLVKLKSILETSSSVPPSNSNLNSNFQNGHCGLKLPRFELSSFSGNVAEWITFKEIFTSSIIQNKQLTDLERFQYLNSSLRGIALQLVKGFSISESNFKDVWQTLVDRFDNKYLLADAQINKIFSLKTIKSGSSKSLHELLDACNETLRNLKNLGYDRNNTVDLILINVIQGKLDDNLRQLFQLTLGKQEEPKFDNLMDFLDKQARSLQVVKESSVKVDISKSNPRKASVNSTTVQHPSNCCILCKNSHILCKCDKFLKMPVDQRWSLVKQHNCCFNCLRANHRVSACLFNTQCKYCQQKHHSLLHKEPSKGPAVKESMKSCHAKVATNTQEEQLESCHAELNQTTSKLKCFSSTNDHCQVLLSTAIIKVKGRHGEFKLFRALIDNGSQKSLISKECCDKLGLYMQKSSHTIHGINDLIAETSLFQIKTQFSAHFNNRWQALDALVVNKVTADLPNFRIPRTEWPHLDNLLLADPDFSKTRPVDILLGADLYAELLLGSLIPSQNGSPSAINSKLGYLLCGKIASFPPSKSPIVNCHANIQLNQELQKFWEIESTLQIQLLSSDDQECEEKYESTVSRDREGRYIVELPFKPNLKLGDTRITAFRRFLSLERKLKHDEKLRSEYNAFMEEYLKLGHMRKCEEAGEPWCEK